MAEEKQTDRSGTKRCKIMCVCLCIKRKLALEVKLAFYVVHIAIQGEFKLNFENFLKSKEQLCVRVLKVNSQLSRGMHL